MCWMSSCECGRLNGVFVCIREVAPDMTWAQCLIHREALTAKSISSGTKIVFESAVKSC